MNKQELGRVPLSWYRHGSFSVWRKLWKRLFFPFFSHPAGHSCDQKVTSIREKASFSDWRPSVLSWNVLFSVFKKIVMWRTVWWKTRTAQNLKVKVSDGILIKLEGKYPRKPMLFWRYLAARTINEMVKKPSLRSAVACYLSGKGRHIELNLFELPKIDI